MRQIFVSHSSKDADLAGRLVAELQALRPEDVYHFSSFHDAGATGGQDWTGWIRRVAANSDLVLFIGTANSRSEWCSAELGMANLLGTPILPLHTGAIEDVNQLALVNHTHAEPIDQPPEAILRLIDGLIGPGADRSPLPDGELEPYPGLRALREQESAFLFGRDRETRAVVRSFDETATARPVVLSGPSGSGKSSLARAGVLPRLRRQGWTVLGPLQPRELADGGVPPTPGSRPAVVVLDQAEELLLIDEDDRDAQVRWLRDAVEHGVWVLVIIRSEFRSELGHLLPKPIDHYVPFLGRDELYAVIRRPAKRANLAIDEVLVDRLVGETGSGDALPLLAMTLRKLWEQRNRKANALELATLNRLGGVQGQLVESANQALTDASDGDKHRAGQVLRVLTRMATPDRKPPTRSPIRVETLTDGEREALDHFAAAGLVAYRTSYALDDQLDVGMRPTGTDLADVTHEALFEWPALAEAIEDERERNELIASLQRAAIEWDDGGRLDRSLLPAGDRLRFAANERLAERGPVLAAFVAAGQRNDRDRRIRRYLVGALAVALIAAGAAAIVAILQRNVATEERDAAQAAEQVAAEARDDAQAAEAAARAAETETRSLRIAARSAASIDGERDLALLAAVAAHQVSPNVGTEGALLQALTAPVGPVRYFTSGPGDQTDWSTLKLVDPDTGVVVGADRRLHTVDLSTGRLGDAVDSPAVEDIEPIPNSLLVTLRGDDPAAGPWAGVYDFGAGQAAWSTADRPVVAVAASGDLLVTAHADGTIRATTRSGDGYGEAVIVDAEVDPDGRERIITDLAIDRQGELLAVASLDGVRLHRRVGDGWGPPTTLVSQPSGARALTRVAFRWDRPGQLFAVGSDPAIHGWTVPDDPDQPIDGPVIIGTHVGGVQALAADPDEGLLYTAGIGGTIQRWNVDGRAEVGEPLAAHRRDTVALSPLAGAGADLLISTDDDTAVLWDLAAGRTIERDGAVPPAWSDLDVTALIGGDGPAAVITGDREVVTVDGGLAAAPTVPVWQGWWVADGDLVFESRNIATPLDGVDLWASTGQAAPTMVAQGVQAVDVGRCLAVIATAAELSFLEVGRCGAVPPTVDLGSVDGGDFVTGVALTDDETRLAVADQAGRIRLIDVADGAVTTTIQSTQPTVITALAWLPDGRLVAGHDIGGDAELIDPAAGDIITLPYHRDAVRFVAASADGRRLFLGGEDATITQIAIDGPPRLVATVTARPRQKENDDDATVFGLRLLDDGTLLSVQNRRLTAWELDPDRLATLACDRAGRDLTDDEAVRLGLPAETRVC
ncbi:MAG: TIR domain-containing protein [Actinomycetota bacterium]